MSALGARDLVISGAGLAVLYLFYQAVDKKKKQNDALHDGLDGWKGGKQFIDPVDVDTHDNFRPSCQQWDANIQLFDNAGNKDWDADKTTCFQYADNSKHPRYVDSEGKIFFKEDDKFLLQDNEDEAGTCFFQDDNHKLFSRPNVSGMNATNRSKRLCFAAGQTAADTGVEFVQTKTNQRFRNPAIPVEITADPHNPWKTKDPTNSYIQSPTNVNKCEFYTELAQDGVDSKQYSWFSWAHTKLSQAFDSDVDGCVKNNGRYWQPTEKRVVYFDKANNQTVTTPIIDGVISAPASAPVIQPPDNFKSLMPVSKPVSPPVVTGKKFNCTEDNIDNWQNLCPGDWGCCRTLEGKINPSPSQASWTAMVKGK